MKAKTVKPVTHRARCKHCGTPPSYYTLVHGGVYHMPTRRGGSVGRANRGRQDYYDRPYIALRSFFEDAYLRSNSIRGAAATSSWYFKKNKNKWGGYRIILSCRCGNSHWMFPSTGDHDTWLRQCVVDLNEFKERRYLEDPNIGKF